MREEIDRVSEECFRSFANIPGAEIIESDGVVGVSNDIPMTFFSGIASARLDESDVHGNVERVMDRFRPKKRPFRWWVSPATIPARLGDVLEAHGMRYVYDSTGMTADLRNVEFDAPLPRGLTIERETNLERWLTILLSVFGRSLAEIPLWANAYAHCGPEWTHFIGLLDGAPVSTSCILVSGDLAGVYHIATLEKARGRGIGATMTRAAMEHGKRNGAVTAALQSSEMAVPMYRSMGFEECCTLKMYDWM